MLEIGRQMIDGYSVTIDQDEFQDESPRDWGPLGNMVCFHNRYTLGDKHGYETPDVFIHMLSGLYPDENTDWLEPEQLARCQSEIENKNIILPLYLYDHSGITMRTSSFGDPWDSGQVGYIYISLEDVRREYSVKRVSPKLRKKVTQYLVNEVSVYDQYLTGDVWCYSIDDTEGECIDSCCGFYGLNDDNGYLENTIKGSIKRHVESLRKAHQQQAILYLKNHVPLDKRDYREVTV